MQLCDFLFFGKYAAVAVCLLLSFFGMGAFILRRNSVFTGRERLFFATTIGMAVWSYIIYLFGLFGLLYKAPVLIIFLASLANALRECWIAKGKLRDSQREERIALAALLLGSVPSFIFSLYPPHSGDDTLYHLLYAKTYVEAHALTVVEFARYPVFNQFTEMLFTGAYLLSGEIASQLVSWISSLVVAFGLYACGRSYFDRGAGLLAASLWFSTPMIWQLASCAYIETTVALLSFACVYAVFGTVLRGNIQYLLLAGVFGGCAFAAKYNAALWFVTLIVVTVFARRGVQPRRQDIVRFALMSLIALVAALPWLVRNYVLSGNPVFPFAANIFGLHELWSTEDYQRWIKSIGEYGVHKTVWNYILLPYRVLRQPLAFNYWGPVLWQFSFALIVTVAGALSIKTLAFRIAALTSIILVTIWFWSVQEIRYVVIAFPTLFLCAAAVVQKLIALFVSSNSGKAIANYACVAGCLLILTFQCQWNFEFLGPLVTNASDRGRFYTRIMPNFGAYGALNSFPKGKAYVLFDPPGNYFYKGTGMGDWVGHGCYFLAMKHMGSGADLYSFLRGLNANYFLVNKDKLIEIKLNLPTDEFFRQHFVPVYDSPHAAAYVLKPNPGPDS